jgi:hypothetical protein
MAFKNLKVVMAVAYVIAIGVLGAVTGISSAIAWVMLAVLAVLPAGALVTFWNEPQPTMSESIARARQ